MAEGKIGVAIADSNILVRTGLEHVLGCEEDLILAGSASNMDELSTLLAEKQPAVLIFDFTARGFSVENVAWLRQKFPSLRIVAITPDQEASTLINALRAGVVSYIKKDCDLGEIVSSVKETAAGGKFFCGQILETIRTADLDVENGDFKSFNCAPVNLSDRELEIITLIAEGYTNAEIAEMLFLSPHTVNTHRKNIMQKLGVNNTAAIVMYAVKANLVNVNKFLFSTR